MDSRLLSAGQSRIGGEPYYAILLGAPPYILSEYLDEKTFGEMRDQAKGLGCAPDDCARYCGIILCRKRRENGYPYCDECSEYPCEDVMEKENRYTSRYPHRESPIENLRMLREQGMEAFLEHQEKYWTCPNCGRPFSVHDTNCPRCGRRIEKK